MMRKYKIIAVCFLLISCRHQTDDNPEPHFWEGYNSDSQKCVFVNYTQPIYEGENILYIEGVNNPIYKKMKISHIEEGYDGEIKTIRGFDENNRPLWIYKKW